MKFLVIADIHGDVENLPLFIEKFKETHDFDVIICPGDWTDVNVPKGFTQEDILLLIIEELKQFNKPIIAVPGNVDPKNAIELLEKEGISVHGKGKTIDDVGFYGYGGAKTPFQTNIEPDEEELKRGLEKAYKMVEQAKYKVQVTHIPPFQTKLDLIAAGLHVGSKVVREFIETKKPSFAVSAHVHEGRGIDYVNGILVINPGRLPEGYAGYVELKQDGSVTGEIVELLI